MQAFNNEIWGITLFIDVWKMQKHNMECKLQFF